MGFKHFGYNLLAFMCVYVCMHIYLKEIYTHTDADLCTFVLFRVNFLLAHHLIYIQSVINVE